jgi:hypothetical protein
VTAVSVDVMKMLLCDPCLRNSIRIVRFGKAEWPDVDKVAGWPM